MVITSHNAEEDAQTLLIVQGLLDCLDGAVESLVGTDMDAVNMFVAASARHLLQAANGYVLLRKSNHWSCSALLIRPMIELILRMTAISKQPEVICRFADKEIKHRQGFLRELMVRNEKDPSEATVNVNPEFAKFCADRFPDFALPPGKIQVREIASIAELTELYAAQYNLYSEFAHGAMEAITGKTGDLTEHQDNPCVAYCLYQAIELLIGMGANAPDVINLRKQLDALFGPFVKR